MRFEYTIHEKQKLYLTRPVGDDVGFIVMVGSLDILGSTEGSIEPLGLIDGLLVKPAVRHILSGTVPAAASSKNSTGVSPQCASPMQSSLLSQFPSAYSQHLQSTEHKLFIVKSFRFLLPVLH